MDSPEGCIRERRVALQPVYCHSVPMFLQLVQSLTKHGMCLTDDEFSVAQHRSQRHIGRLGESFGRIWHHPAGVFGWRGFLLP